MKLNVVTLQESNFRQVSQTLRVIADQIESGDYGDVGCAGLVILGNKMSCFGMGADSEAPSVALLFHAAFQSMSQAVADHGKDQ